jgi:hypothetical protein
MGPKSQVSLYLEESEPHALPEVWKAESLEEEIGAGRTKPLAITCVRIEASGKRSRRTMIVKALGLPEITTGKLLNELLGNLIARALGVATPSPALVEISPEFLAAVSGQLPPGQQGIQPGLAVGTEKVDGLMPLPSGFRLARDEVDWKPFIRALEALSDERLDRLEEQAPVEW